jgi:hypothetical protein
MIIPANDASQFIDTDKLTDKDAEIHEVMKHLYDVLRKYKTTAFLRIILDEKRFIGFTSTSDTKSRLNVDFDFLMSEIHNFVQSSTNGRLAIMEQTDGPEFPSDK